MKDTLEQQKASYSIEGALDPILILKFLKRWISEHESEILHALNLDLGKQPFESYATEILPVMEEIKYFLKNIHKLKRNKRVSSPLTHFKSKSWIMPHPVGQVLIVSPWNYPFQLSLSPTIAALCAGNCVVLKPSEHSNNTSKLLHSLFSDPIFKGQVLVVLGDATVSQKLLENRFDTLFFTGSSAVGKIVMRSAAEHLTPVILELGGKNPCIVDETSNLKLAAKRIVWGKFINAGQTCLAPDYLVVHESVVDKLTAYITQEIQAQWQDDLGKIINEKHFKRLLNLLEDTSILHGGEHDVESLHIAPTLIAANDFAMPIMKEEIFGPLLPIMSYKNIDEVMDVLTKKEHPLALYLFSEDVKTQTLVLENLQFGGACINDVLIHFANLKLPFGGVGNSGMGSYHGKASFDAFTHYKSIMKKTNHFDIKIRYAPYKGKIRILRYLTK